MGVRSVLATLALLAAPNMMHTAAAKIRTEPEAISDAALVKTLPGFSNAKADVNGVSLPYVTGGHGPPVFLLPGWPETWWARTARPTVP